MLKVCEIVRKLRNQFFKVFVSPVDPEICLQGKNTSESTLKVKYFTENFSRRENNREHVFLVFNEC